MEIEIKHVKYRYKNAKEDTLKDISMKLEVGKVTGIIGKSGSGKTTLLEMMNGLRTPTEGMIQIGNFCISSKKIENIEDLRFQVGLVFQFPEEQFFHLTVQEELEMPLKFYHYKREKILTRVKNALAMVDLDENYLTLDPHKLSSGEKRKIALASILVLNPEVLVLDEPTIGLDKEGTKMLLKLFRLLKNRYGKTIMIASHDIEFLHKIVDYIYVLDDGKVVLEGNKYDVLKQEELLRQYGVLSPKIISFSNYVLKEKNIKMGYRDEINDLLKDIYRYVK